VSGVESPGVVRVRLDALPELSLPNPLLETDDAWVTIASAEMLDEAVTVAVGDMADLIVARSSLSLTEAVMLMSATGNAQICQVVDPLKTARFVMPKWVLAPYGFAL
jgi:amidase